MSAQCRHDDNAGRLLRRRHRDQTAGVALTESWFVAISGLAKPYGRDCSEREASASRRRRGAADMRWYATISTARSSSSAKK